MRKPRKREQVGLIHPAPKVHVLYLVWVFEVLVGIVVSTVVSILVSTRFWLGLHSFNCGFTPDSLTTRFQTTFSHLISRASDLVLVGRRLCRCLSDSRLEFTRFPFEGLGLGVHPEPAIRAGGALAKIPFSHCQAVGGG